MNNLLLNHLLIEKFLSPQTKTLLQKIEIFPSIDSTNQYLLEQAKKQNNLEAVAVFAEEQTAGRGQQGRRWYSPFGCNIYLSILWKFSAEFFATEKFLGLSLAASVATITALKRFGITSALQVKWPNDIYWQQKKLAGILVEMTKNHTVIGIGLNVDLSNQNITLIDQPWVDIKTIISAAPDRNQLSGLLLDEFILLLDNFSRQGFTPYQATWNQLDIYQNKAVLVNTANQQIQGIAKGVNSRGELLVLTANDTLHSLFSSEVKVRLL